MSKRPGDSLCHSSKSKKSCTPCELSSCTCNIGWQASLGMSLADRLEQITSVQNLTTRQVKRLLRDVLTNEDVITALRRYINGELREPETGELSASTKRRAKNLGLFGLSNNSNDASNYHFQSRAITRSLTRRIQQSLREQMKTNPESGTKQPRTILDMDFPDDIDSNRFEETNRPMSNLPLSTDTDYQPDVVDLELLKRDQDLDLNDATYSNMSSSTQSSISTEDTRTISPDSIADNNHTGPEETSVECSIVRSPHVTRSLLKNRTHESSTAASTPHLCSDKTTSNSSYRLSDLNTSEWHLRAEASPKSCGPDNIDASEDDVQLFESENQTVAEDNGLDLDQEDEVYNEFLRSLFPSTDNTPVSTPNKANYHQSNYHADTGHMNTNLSGNGHPTFKTEEPQILTLETPTINNSDKAPNPNDDDDDDDPNDPEFDVMAEMDHVDREDFFYELRDDRAVRVSKLETKYLHEDLCELFDDEEDDPNSGPGASSVLVMKARVQRFFSNDQEQSQPVRSNVSSPVDPTDMDSDVSHKPTSSMSAAKPRLDSSDLMRLQRQLGMHIQLLATNFFLTFDFPDLRASVTTHCSTFLRAMACTRDTFDLMALQRTIQSGQPKITSFYWKCKVLDQAIELVSNYAGLTMVPWIRDKNPQTSMVGKIWNPNLYDIPLPHCLLRLMVNSPVWSYAYLMPKVLSSHSKASRRFNFHPSEDALLLMGLANYSGALVPFVKTRLYRGSRYRKYTRLARPTQQPKPVRYLTYRLIGRNMLPHRSLLQLRSRRWNLLGNMGTPVRSNACSIPTHRLLRIFTDLGQTNGVDMDLIQHYANEMASLTFVHGLPITESCLTDRPKNQLFTVEKLPMCYDVVLNPGQSKNEVSRKRRDIISDFIENAQCLWRPRIKSTNTIGGQTIMKAVNASTSSSVQLIATNLNWDVLGPTFLPAIPVDVTSDGNLVLSRNTNPTVVQIDSTGDQANSFLGATASSEFIRDHLRPESDSTTMTDHIEFVLQRIRKQLSAGQQLSAKISEPISPPIEQTPSPDPSVIEKPTDLEITKDSTLPDPLIPSDPTIGNCQEIVDCLCNLYHVGLDKIYMSHGETYFGPRKFNSLFKPCPLSPSNLEADITTITTTNTNTNPSAPTSQQTLSTSETAPVQATSVFPPTCFVTPGRFITRCRARGEASTADFITLPNSILYNRQSVRDELDVRRARSLLDRCRLCLPPSDYGTIMSTLSTMHQLIQNSMCDDMFDRGSRFKKIESKLIELLYIVLHHLKDHRPLWEDFVYLLTSEQARLLRLLPTYFNLIRTARVQRVLQDLIPRGKRFWRLLRNLADGCATEARNMSVQNSISRTILSDIKISPNCQLQDNNVSSDQVDSNHCQSNTIGTENRPKFFRPRGVRLRGRSLSDCVTKAWSVLESTWRSRPVLLSNISNLLNTRHKPYCNFEQSFEEVDLLARHPLGTSTSIITKLEPPSEFENHSCSASNQEFLPNVDYSSMRDGWEVCTELSSGNSHTRRGSAVAWNHRQCPCKCHPNLASNGVSNLVTNQSGKPAKVDSLGLRHCMSCSLRVHNGIVYVDECNFHLRHVHITWPVGFKPKSILRRSPKIKTGRLTSHLANHTSHTRSGQMVQHIPVNSSANRFTLANLAESLSCPPTTSNIILPDMANRSIAVEFLPSDPEPQVVVPDSCDLTLKPPSVNEHELGANDANPEDPDTHKFSDEDEDGISNPKSTFKNSQDAQDSARSASRCQNSPFWDIDDEAACFNTEAFSNDTFEPQTQIHSGPSPSTSDHGRWTPQEDRQLLEYCKTRGHYSSSMFTDLAQIWVPVPGSIRRTAIELEHRFKHLMFVTLGDAYDPQLFESPRNDYSADESDDQLDHDDNDSDEQNSD